MRSTFYSGANFVIPSKTYCVLNVGDILDFGNVDWYESLVTRNVWIVINVTVAIPVFPGCALSTDVNSRTVRLVSPMSKYPPGCSARQNSLKGKGKV